MIVNEMVLTANAGIFPRLLAGSSERSPVADSYRWFSCNDPVAGIRIDPLEHLSPLLRQFLRKSLLFFQQKNAGYDFSYRELISYFVITLKCCRNLLTAKVHHFHKQLPFVAAAVMGQQNTDGCRQSRKAVLAQSFGFYLCNIVTDALVGVRIEHSINDIDVFALYHNAFLQ